MLTESWPGSLEQVRDAGEGFCNPLVGAEAYLLFSTTPLPQQSREGLGLGWGVLGEGWDGEGIELGNWVSIAFNVLTKSLANSKLLKRPLSNSTVKILPTLFQVSGEHADSSFNQGQVVHAHLIKSLSCFFRKPSLEK